MAVTAKIAVENAAYSFDKLYDYAVPADLALAPGQRVTVPFGRGDSLRLGLVLSLEEAPEPLPERLCRDPLVKESLRGRSGFCGRRDGALCLLSAPFRPDRPFPIPVLFCLARVERRGGRPWLVWAFDLEGTPVLPRIEPPEGGHTEGAD